MEDSSGQEGFTPFDPMQGSTGSEEGHMSDQFEDFDVQAEPEEVAGEISIESFGGLSETEDELRSVLAARDEAERRLMPEAGEVLSAMAEDGTAGLGNVVGVGIAEKVMGGGPTGRLGVTVFVKEKEAPRNVASDALVPESIGGVATDVEAIGEV